VNFSFAAANKALSRFMPTKSPATYAILTLSCLLYAGSFLWTIRLGEGGFSGGLLDLGGVDGRVLDALGASLSLPINLQEPWRFVMAIFLHANLLHIGFNMWVLMDVGPVIEELYGSARYIFIYVVTGIGGYLLTSFFNSAALGGSGALLGLIGVLLAMTMGHQTAGMRMLRSQLIRWLIYIGLISLLPGVSLLAHLGGFASGFLLGRVLKDRQPATPSERQRAAIFGWVTVVIVVASLAMALKGIFQGT
jgi:rhomboid protease GluP